jgi:hypothetical protein
MKTTIEGHSLIRSGEERITGNVRTDNNRISYSIRVSGEWSVNIPELVGAVREDPDLTPQEKEFTITGTKTDKEYVVNTEIRGQIRRLLRLTYNGVFEPTELRVNTDTAWGKRVAPHRYTEGAITGVKGYVPIGIVKLLNKCRTDLSPAEVVSNEVQEPENADTSAEENPDDENMENRQDSDQRQENPNDSFSQQSALSW